MSRSLYGNFDLVTNQLLNVRLQMLGSDPSSLEAQIYYNSTAKEIRFHNGTTWVALGPAGAGGPPTGAAGGDLTGSYPTPQIATGVIVDADVSATAAIAQTKIANLVSNLAGKPSDQNEVQAGMGLTGGGNLSATRVINVGAGSGIVVLSDTVAVDNTQVQFIGWKGSANGYAPLDANSLIPTAHIPPLAINEVFVVASQAAMLALTAQRGDMAIRTDTGKTYVLSTDAPTVLADWKEVMATGQVVSVNGSTGVVSVTTASIGAAPQVHTHTIGDLPTGTSGTTVALGNHTHTDAPKWTTARTITLGTDLTGSVSIDGSANVTLNATLAAGAGGKRYAVALGTASPQVITHNLNTRDVVVSVYNSAGSFEEIDLEVEHTSVNTVTLRHNPALPAGYRAVVLG